MSKQLQFAAFPGGADQRNGHASAGSRLESFERPSRADANEIVTTGLRVQDDRKNWRYRTARPGAPTHLEVTQTRVPGGTGSQEEYEESESESDRVLSSSGEDPAVAAPLLVAIAMPKTAIEAQASMQRTGEAPAQGSDNDDENRTAVNYPLKQEACFTPQPNAFSHPPGGRPRNTTQPVSDSYFPAPRPSALPRHWTEQSVPTRNDVRRPSHLPQNPLSPSYNAAAEHDEALRASLSGLLSVAAAARGLPKSDAKRPVLTSAPHWNNRSEPVSFRIVPESALPTASPPQLQELVFKPTIRRTLTDSTSTLSEQQQQHNEHKRKAAVAPVRNTSRERRALKKARRSAASEESFVTPTLLTWMVSAGVVVFLSAISFGAGYSVGREAGRLDAAASFAGEDQLRSCAREASRSGMGLKRSLARSAIQV